jgi:hypothetical protein
MIQEMIYNECIKHTKHQQQHQRSIKGECINSSHSIKSMKVSSHNKHLTTSPNNNQQRNMNGQLTKKSSNKNTDIKNLIYEYKKDTYSNCMSN